MIIFNYFILIIIKNFTYFLILQINETPWSVLQDGLIYYIYIIINYIIIIFIIKLYNNY